MALDVPLNKPWMHRNASGSSLRGMEIAIPPGQEHPQQQQQNQQQQNPPPLAVTHFDSKPLPPVPRRQSTSPSFSEEGSNVFKAKPRDAANPNWEKQEADISVMLEGRISQHQRQSPRREVDSGFCAAPSEEHTSSQPGQPLRKIWQHSKGVHSSAASSAASSVQSPPTGHNPVQKVRQITGFEMPAQQGFTPGPDSTSGSSVYSYDRDAPKSGARPKTPPVQSGAHVAHFIRRDQKAAGGSSPALPSPNRKDWDGTSGSNSSVGSPVPLFAAQYIAHGNALALQSARDQRKYGTDLYHASTSQIAQSTARPRLDETTKYPTEPAKPPSSKSSGLSMLSDLKTGFAERVNRSKVRMAPPAELPRPKHSDSFGSGSHPLRTPYPPQRPYQPQSVFDDDSDDSDVAEILPQRESPPPPPSGGAGRWFRRDSVHDRAAGLGQQSSAGQQQGTFVISNRARRADGPDTPFFFPLSKTTASASAGFPAGVSSASVLLQRTGEQAKGLVAQAMRKVHVRSKAERRRDALRSKIRVITEADLAGAGAGSGVRVSQDDHHLVRQETRQWL